MSAGKNNRKLSDTAAARVTELEALAQRDYSAIDPTWRLALGTLGGGNHFIELATDESDTVWATLHSGSRGIGNKIGNLHIRRAQAIATAEHGIRLPDRDLAYLTEGTQEFDDYIRDVLWAQKFARLNRDEMMDRVMAELSQSVHGDSAHVRRSRCSASTAITTSRRSRAFRRADLGHTQRRDRSAARDVGDDSRLDGHAQLHRHRAGESDGVQLRAAWRRPAPVADGGAQAVHDERSRRGDAGASSSAGLRCCSTRSRRPTRTSTR